LNNWQTDGAIFQLLHRRKQRVL